MDELHIAIESMFCIPSPIRALMALYATNISHKDSWYYLVFANASVFSVDDTIMRFVREHNYSYQLKAIRIRTMYPNVNIAVTTTEEIGPKHGFPVPMRLDPPIVNTQEGYYNLTLYPPLDQDTKEMLQMKEEMNITLREEEVNLSRIMRIQSIKDGSYRYAQDPCYFDFAHP